jgi:hypothetical protein
MITSMFDQLQVQGKGLQGERIKLQRHLVTMQTNQECGCRIQIHPLIILNGQQHIIRTTKEEATTNTRNHSSTRPCSSSTATCFCLETTQECQDLKDQTG